MEAFGIVLPPRAKNIVIARCKPDGTGGQIAAPCFLMPPTAQYTYTPLSYSSHKPLPIPKYSGSHCVIFPLASETKRPWFPGYRRVSTPPIKRFSIESLAGGRAFSLRPGFFRGKIGKNGVRSQKDGKRIGTRPVISGQEKRNCHKSGFADCPGLAGHLDSPQGHLRGHGGEHDRPLRARHRL